MGSGSVIPNAVPLPPYDQFVPSITLWNEAEDLLLFTFLAVDDTNIPQANNDSVIITNLRSSGAVVINGGLKPFEGFLHFYLFGSGYPDVMGQTMNLYNTIKVNVPYALRIQTDSNPSHDILYHVKRTQDFEWLGISKDYRNYRQEVRIHLLCYAW